MLSMHTYMSMQDVRTLSVFIDAFEHVGVHMHSSPLPRDV